jgi:uncharacterized protein YlzI (FlbEa/FlbD family)
MLELNRLNGETVWINPDQVKLIFKCPDTTLVFIDDSTMTVKDSIESVREKWMEYQRKIRSLEVQT